MTNFGASSWKESVAAALIGLNRSPTTCDAASFLDQSCIASAARRAGRMPPRLPEAPPFAPHAAPSQTCSRDAARILSDIIVLGDALLIAEWALLAADRCMTVPPALLPDVLDTAAAYPRLRDLIEPVLGERGMWLATHRSQWRAAVPSFAAESAEAVWETGKRAERFAALRALRRRNADAARALIDSSWKSLPATDRTDTIAVIAETLSMLDEPFLESCLDDRAVTVQQAAAQALARLPKSRFANRMRQRLTACVCLSHDAADKWRTGVRRGTLILRPPAACDDAMRRDGIVHRYNPAEAESWYGITQDDAHLWRVDEPWWLMQIIAAAPPGCGFRHEGASASPDDLILAAMAHEQAHVPLTGWRYSAALHRDPDWAEALLERWCVPSGDLSYVESLWPALTPSQRDRIGPMILDSRAARSHRVHLAVQLLDHACLELSRACLDAIEQSAKQQHVDLESVARRVHRSLATEALAMSRRILDTSYAHASHVANRILTIRARLAEEFPA